MAQYQWKAADGTVGSAPTGLDNALTGDGQLLADWQIVADASASGGKALKLIAANNVRRRLTIPGLDEPTERVDIRGRFYKSAASSPSMHMAVVRDKGTATANAYSYFVNITSSNVVQIARYATSFSDYTTTPTVATAHQPGWFHYRYTYVPGGSPRHRFAMWRPDLGESDAAPAYLATSDDITATVNGGRVGFGSFTANNDLLDWITVGTGVDDAATEPTASGTASANGAFAGLTLSAPTGTATGTSSAPAVNGVTVTLYDGITAQASVTGITARWWDSPTAEGAPLLKTDTASTDASGVLTLDLDAVTSLAVGAEGYLSLYKAGATAQDDLHFAGRLTVSDVG